jgi:hypothetical protein
MAVSLGELIVRKEKKGQKTKTDYLFSGNDITGVGMSWIKGARVSCIKEVRVSWIKRGEGVVDERR